MTPAAMMRGQDNEIIDPNELHRLLDEAAGPPAAVGRLRESLLDI